MRGALPDPLLVSPEPVRRMLGVSRHVELPEVWGRVMLGGRRLFIRAQVAVWMVGEGLAPDEEEARERIRAAESAWPEERRARRSKVKRAALERVREI